MLHVNHCGVAASQTPETFVARMGDPNEVVREKTRVVKQTFYLDRQLETVVDYNKAEHPTNLRIKPRNSKLEDIKTDPVVSQDTLISVLDGILSKEDRGKLIIGTFLHYTCDGDCGAGVLWNYRNSRFISIAAMADIVMWM